MLNPNFKPMAPKVLIELYAARNIVAHAKVDSGKTTTVSKEKPVLKSLAQLAEELSDSSSSDSQKDDEDKPDAE